MKKICLTFGVLLFMITAAYTQTLTPVKIDKLVTVSLPAQHFEKDTLGQQVYEANGMYGYMTILRTANAKNTAPLKKRSDLNRVLKGYIKSFAGQAANSDLEHVRDTTVGTLTAKAFTVTNTDDAGNVQISNFTLIYTQDAVYTFEYVYPQIRADLVKDEYKAFVSSIKLSPELQRNDQYLSNAAGMSPAVKIGIYSLGALIIILAVVVLARRKRAPGAR